jgi:hypothetical protein
MRETATYVYCLAESSRSPSLAKAPSGLPHATRPAAIEIKKGLWAVVSDVPLSLYGADRLEPRLKDINWVADSAIAHEAVVEYIASREGTSVVPLKLFTMFSSRARAAADLAARLPEIRSVLDRIRGCNEWGVRVTRRATLVWTAAVPAATSGTAFLAAKKRERESSRAGLVKATDAAERAFVALAKLAREARRREAPESATSPPLVDATFLVAVARRVRFRTTARRLAKSCRSAGADLVLTGPWPAYNFVQQTVEDAPA